MADVFDPMAGQAQPVTAAAGDGEPAVHDIGVAVYVIPTDAPEADGTLAWNKTTMIVVTARAGAERGIGWTYGAAASPSIRW